MYFPIDDLVTFSSEVGEVVFEPLVEETAEQFDMRQGDLPTPSPIRQHVQVDPDTGEILKPNSRNQTLF